MWACPFPFLGFLLISLTLRKKKRKKGHSGGCIKFPENHKLFGAAAASASSAVDSNEDASGS